MLTNSGNLQPVERQVRDTKHLTITDYIIIGNGVAGTCAAEAIRANDPNGSISIFTKESYPFYARIRLPHFIAGEIPLEKLILKDDAWYKEKKIDLHLDTDVIDADPKAKTITIKSGGTFRYRKLLLAAGSHSFIPPIKGVDQGSVFTLRNIDDATMIIERLKSIKKAVIIGGGLLGLEAGKALMCHGIEIAVVAHSDRLLSRQIDVAGGEILKCMMERLGYNFHMNLNTEEIISENGQLKVLMRDGTQITGDIVLISSGVRPNLALAEKFGLLVNKGVIIDDHIQTSEPGIFAAGDIAEHNGRLYGIWPAAKEQGTAAGKNMAGITEMYTGTVFMTALKVAGINLTTIGEIEEDDSSRCIINIDNENGIYKKYVIKDDALIGCILLGDTKDQRKLERAIRDKKHLDEPDVRRVME